VLCYPLTYVAATQTALENATGILLKQGFANGSMLGSFICLYAVLCLYGGYLLYNDVQETGCDPSDGVDGNSTCDSSGPDVFGAMLGVAFAGQGISQVGNFLETFAAAKVAAFGALKAMHRKPGAAEERIYQVDKDGNDLTKSTTHSTTHHDLETPEGKVRAILPKYEIDSSATTGKQPENVQGHLVFENVKFSYPTRPGQQVLNDFSVQVPPGKTIAFVGPR